ncbi:pullulanase [Mycoplasmopsis mustelae]|uniref:Pullulanase n=1 Tax=Mycoplasmopsis mustelae TaxID=171289 RepID=A0A4R7UCP7_9BACT|nr:alpha-amylase family glycosyl hydrolase [Mycoplasmopsis mustelae]TDV24212.1 pullulanase [Mycoplasmopsis mustelae]
MKIKYKNTNFFKEFDTKYAYKKPDLGIKFLSDSIQLKLWQPLAHKVRVFVYDKNNTSKIIQIFDSQKLDTIWKTFLPLELEGNYYQYQIWHPDGQINFALDPYAISLAAFDWEGDEKKIAFGALVNINSKKAGKKPKTLQTLNNNHTDNYIYELHVRDFTSLKSQKDFQNKLGTFNALLEADLFGYVKKLGISHVQLLPIQSVFSLNEQNQNILYKNKGSHWTTNYNWGYDPHNYFSINGQYSSNPNDPYVRIAEFRNLVAQAHQKGIGVIMDVVYNHMMTNNIFNNILDGYYYRDNAKIKPVIYAPLADERYMVRRLMIDSLKYFVQEFGIDGFRFDLSCFHHKETIDMIAKELRAINPNIILYGEAWKFSDLKYSQSYIKGISGNNIAFGYFNDTVRNAIKGDEHSKFQPGLISKFDKKLFKQYVSSVVGNISDFEFGEIKHSKVSYDLFANDIAINLNYVACHDGMTLWDKINTTTQNISFLQRIEMYRQALMMTVFCQGRQFVLAGTELLQSKPCDISGEEADKCVFGNYDDFNEQPDNNAWHWNSYKTTDYTNGLKWLHLENRDVQKYVFDFFKKLNKFRQQTEFFRLSTNQAIKENLKFQIVDQKRGILSLQIKVNKQTVEVIHNFSDSEFSYDKDKKVLFSSKINYTKGILQPHHSVLLEVKNG